MSEFLWDPVEGVMNDSLLKIGELVGHLADERASDRRLDKATDKLSRRVPTLSLA